MNEIFVKRYPSKGGFPDESGEYHVVIKSTGEKDVYRWRTYTDHVEKFYYEGEQEDYWANTFEFWLQEKTLPSDEENEWKREYEYAVGEIKSFQEQLKDAEDEIRQLNNELRGLK